MLRIIILLSFIFLSSLAYGQLRFIYQPPAFDSLFNAAQYASEVEDYKKSARLYDEAYSACKQNFPVIIFYQYAFQANYLAGYIDRSVYYLNIYVEASIFNDRHYNKLLNDEKYAALRAQSDWPKILETIKHKRQYYAEVLRTLEMVNARDQALRQLFKCSNFTEGSLEQKYLNDLIEQGDSINLAEVEQIIEKHGWLGVYEIGEKGNSTLWQVIQHASYETQKKYMPIIRKAVKEGNASVVQMAFLEDRFNIYQGRAQLYGTQVVKTNGVYQVYPIVDPENIEERRATIGIEPLAEYLEFFDIEINTIEDLQLDHLLDPYRNKDDTP